MKLILLLCSVISFVAAQTPARSGGDACVPKPAQYSPGLPAKLMEGMGAVHFPITTANPEAQKFFDQGLAQMHSFWAVEAERSFRQAAALDPNAPMPQWGIAMVAPGDFRPRFQLQDGDNRGGTPHTRAVEAARRARELAAVSGKATDLERMYVEAIAARRLSKAGDADDAFVAGLRQVVAKYPAEVEARSYLALMIMRGFVLPAKTPRHAESMEAATILKDLLRDAPDHPGVHHFVIHGFEGSTFASEAWPSCKRYAELVTNIPHALHMPGHIYAQTARWEDAAKSFSSAAANERKYMAADSLYGGGHHGHNVHFLVTSYAFSGQYDKAIASARELLAIPETPAEAKNAGNFRTAAAQGWFAMMRTLVQFEKWDEILNNAVLPAPVKPRLKAWHHWSRAIASANKGQPDRAEAESKLFHAALEEYKRTLKSDPHPSLLVAKTELQAQMALANGKWKRAQKGFDKAIAAERSLRYNEPPNYPRPVAEGLGRAALRRKDSQTAERAFRIALEQYPADWHAEAGLRALADGGVRTAAR